MNSRITRAQIQVLKLEIRQLCQDEKDYRDRGSHTSFDNTKHEDRQLRIAQILEELVPNRVKGGDWWNGSKFGTFRGEGGSG